MIRFTLMSNVEVHQSAMDAPPATYYTYDLSGHVIAEYECQTCWNVGYMYLNGQAVAEYYANATYFYSNDHLGSTRLLIGYPTASMVQCEYYYPYGDNVLTCPQDSHG